MSLNKILEQYGFQSRFDPVTKSETQSVDEYLTHLEQKFEVDKLAVEDDQGGNEDET